MPNNNNRINFQVGYNVDQASVNAVKKSLRDLQNIKMADFTGPQSQLIEIQKTAKQVEIALTKAFNPSLNTVNLQRFKGILAETGRNLDSVYSDFSKAGAAGRDAFGQMTSKIIATNTQLTQTKTLLSSMGQTMMNTVKWGIASSVMNTFTNSVRQAFDYVKALDSSLNDIRIVTKQSSDEMANFAVQANNSAQALGRSTMDYTKAALTFYQQGLDEAAVQARTESVLKAQNITGAGEEMADYLTAVWNGYKVANEEAELYVDKLAAVADRSASNMSQLAIAMSKVASSANLLGVPVDKLNAQIATITATTRQAPETVGNALKTIYSRINDIATGADDAEISLGNYSAKMMDVGISVLDANGNLRDTGDVIDEIGAKWETLSHEQQIYLARTMAGQRQYNNLLALFENWGKYSDLVNVSMQAQGTTAQKNAIYMESLAAKMEQLGAAGERVKDSFINEEDLKGLVDFGTNAVNVFASLVEGLGGGSNAIIAFGSVITSVFSGVIGKEIGNFINQTREVRASLDAMKQSALATKEMKGNLAYSEDPVYAEYINNMERMQQVWSVMSKQEIKAQEVRYNDIRSLQQQVNQFKQNTQAGQKLINVLNGKNFDLSKSNLTIKLKQSLQELDENINTVTTHLAQFSKPNFANQQQAAEAFARIQKEIIQLRDQTQIPIPDNIMKALLKDTDAFGQELDQNLSLLLSYVNQIKNAKLGAEKFREFSQEAADAYHKMKQLSEEAKRAQQNAETIFNAQGLVKFASGLGRVASGISSIVNLTKTWKNDSLSAGEKLLQTFTTLSFVLPSIITGFKDIIGNIGSLGSGIKTLAANILTNFGKVGVSVATQNGIIVSSDAEVVAANMSVATSFGAIIAAAAPFIAIAAAIGVAVYAMYKTWNQENQAAQKAAQTAKKAKQTYDDLKSSYDNLKSSLENYNSAQDAIAEMTKGTQEWRDAIRESNDAVLELIQNYPQLAKQVQNVNGQLKISKSAQEQALASMGSAVDNARLASIAATASSRDASLAARARQSSRFIGVSTQTSQDIMSGYDITMATTEQVISVIQAYGDNFSTNTQQMIRAISEETGVSQEMVTAIINGTDNIKALSDEYVANTQATKLAYEAIASERLQGNAIYKGFDDLGKQIAETIAGQDLQTAEKQRIDYWMKYLTDGINANSWNSNPKVQYMLAELNRVQQTNWGMGAVHGTDANRSFDFVTQTGQHVQWTAKQVAATIAAAQALQNLNNSAQKASKMFSGMESTGQADALKTFTAGNGFGDFTQSQLRNINPKSHEMAVYFNTYAKQAGYQGGKAYQDAFIEGLQSDIAKFDKIGKQYLSQVSQAYDKNFKDKDITLGTAQKIASSLNQAFIYGGSQGLNSLKDVLDGLSSDDLQKLFSSIEQIDWTQDGAAYQLQKILEDQDIAISDTNESWKIFINLLDQVSSKSVDATSKLDNLRGTVSSLKDIEPGKVLNDQDYQELIKLQPQLEKMFKISDQGYMFIGTQEQVVEAIKTTTQQTIEQLKQMDQVATQISKKDFSKQIANIDFGSEGLLSQSSFQSFQKITSDEALNNALKLVGVDQQAFHNAEQIIKNYQNMPASQMTEGMKQSYNQAKQIVTEALNEIVELQTQGEEGFYQNSLRQVQQLNATRAQSLEELRNLYYEEQILLEDYGDMRETLVNKEIEDLGITREAYDATFSDIKKYLEETEEGFAQLDQTRKDLEVDELVSRVYELGDALEDLSSYKDFESLNQIKEFSNSVEFNELAQGLRTALEGIFNTPIDNQFIADNLDLIERLANQDVDALGQLQAKLGQDYVAEIRARVDPNSTMTAFDDLNNLILSTDFNNIDLYTQLDNTAFYAALEQLAQEAGLTADDINAILERIGFQPDVTEKSVTLTDENHSVDGGVHTIEYEGLDGEKLTATYSDEVFSKLATGNTIKIPVINGKSRYVGGGVGARAARPSSSIPKSSGKGGGGGGGGSKAKAPTQAKTSKAGLKADKVKAPYDPYEQVNKQYQRQADILDDLKDKQKKLVNKDRLKNLQEQNKALEKQADILKDKLDISNNSSYENTAAYFANQISNAFENALFDSDGQLADRNALEAQAEAKYKADAQKIISDFEAYENAYNDWISSVYNKASAEQQQNLKQEKENRDQLYKTRQKQAQDDLKQVKDVYTQHTKLLDSYEKEWQQQKKIKEELKQIEDQLYENRIAASKIKVDLSIDTGDFERDWLEFENKFIKKLDKDDFLGSAKASAKELMSYFNSKQVQQTANQIKKIRDQIAIMNAGAVSEVYGTNLAQAKEDLEDYMKQQMKDLQEIQDMVDDIKDNYLDAIDNAKDKMDDQIDQYERVNDLIDHNVKLTQLLYGDKAYNSMDRYYNLQKANNERELASLKKQQDYWQSRMNNQVVGSEAWQKFKKNLDDATDSLNDKLEDMIDKLADQFENRVNGIIDRLNNTLTGGRGLDFLDEQWDYISNYDDNFLDTFETKTGIEEVERLYQSQIDTLAGSPKSQQKLNKLMNDQLKLLREKDHLTQYDLDRAKASLQVEKARLALEEARDRKTKMRLRRDSQGNYTYQYVADEEKLGDLQAALADAQANLYNTDKQHYKQNLNTLYDTYKEYIEKMRDLTAEYNATQDEEERKRIQGRIDLLKESTAKLMGGLTEDNKYLLNYLNGSFFDGMGTDTSTLTMEEQMEIMKENIPYMQSQIQDLSNTIVGEGGILPATADMIKEINAATAEYDKNVKSTLATAGTSLQTIEQAIDKEGNALDKNITNAQNLITANDELIKSCQAQIEAMEKLLDYMDKYLNKVMSVQTLLNNLRSAYNTGQGLNGSNLTADNIDMTSWGMDTTAGAEYTGNPATDAAAIKRQIDTLMAQYQKFLQGMSIATFDTGGYTGTWADAEGRLAFLHQGELVLNQDDTKNILNAVQLVRNMANAITNFANGEIGSLMSGAIGMLGGISNTEQLDQNVHIEANFPNVTQHTEIEQAFENLVNMASMRASKYRD